MYREAQQKCRCFFEITIKSERSCLRWRRCCAAYSRTVPHSDLGCRIQNREPLHASQKTETACNPDLHRNRTPRGSKTCWLYSGHLTVWRIARTERTRIPELPKARVEHAAGPSAAIPE